MAATPAVPEGVSAATPPAPTTVTAVTTDWLPLGRVLVCTIVLVVEDDVLLLDGLELPAEGEMVWTPPPTVETTVRPTLLVLVITSPFVRLGDEAAAEEAAVGEGDAPAEDDIDAVGLELAPPTIAPLDEVLVDGVVGVVLEPAPAGVALVPVVGVEVVLEEVPPPS